MCCSGSRDVPPRDVVPVPRVEGGIGHHVQGAAGHPVHMRRDQLGVGARRLHPGLGQPGRGDGHLVEQKVHGIRPGHQVLSAVGRDLLGAAGRRQRVDDRVEVPVDDVIQVVGLVADPVIGDPVLREVVGADPLRPVDVGHLAPALGRGLRVGLLLSLGERRARRMRMACSLFCSWLFSFWQDTTMPVGRCVIRTAESVGIDALAAGSRRAEDVDPQVAGVDGDLDRVRLRP